MNGEIINTANIWWTHVQLAHKLTDIQNNTIHSWGLIIKTLSSKEHNNLTSEQEHDLQNNKKKLNITALEHLRILPTQELATQDYKSRDASTLLFQGIIPKEIEMLMT